MPPCHTQTSKLFLPEVIVAFAATMFQIIATSSNGYSDAWNQSYLLNIGGATSARSRRDIDVGEDEERVF